MENSGRRPKKRTRLLVLFWVAAFLFGLFPFQAKGTFAQEPASKAIKWLSYQDSLELGKKRDKKILLNFFADWCAYCVKMEKETFRDPAVVSYLNRYFVSARVNSDIEQAIARQYKVRGLPSTWFLSESGESIGNMPGYISANTLLNILSFVETESYKKMTFQQYMQNM